MLTEIIATTVGGLLTWSLQEGIRYVRLGGFRRTIAIFEPKDSQFNKDFYRHFRQCVARAQDEILVTGEGFEYKGRDGERIADEYHGAMRDALGRGIQITRMQTLRPLHSRWADKLADLLDRFPDNFHLYVVRNNDHQDIASVCVIDPHPRSNIVEFLLSSETDLDDSPVRLASTGVFIHGKKGLALSVRKNILEIRSMKITVPCRNRSDLFNLLAGTRPVTYFAYGSNMSGRQMEARCPGAIRVGVGRLNGYEIVFNRKGSRRPGAVAGIQKSAREGSFVEGVVWEVTSADIQALDRLEEVLDAYARRTLPVQMDGDVIECEAYVSVPQPDPPPPDLEYSALVIEAALDAGISPQHIETLRRVTGVEANHP